MSLPSKKYPEKTFEKSIISKKIQKESYINFYQIKGWIQ